MMEQEGEKPKQLRILTLVLLVLLNRFTERGT